MRKKLLCLTIAILLFSSYGGVDSYAIYVHPLTYEDIIVSSIQKLSDFNFKNPKECVQFAYENKLITKEDFRSYKLGKNPTRLFAATMIKNMLGGTEVYPISPYEDVQSLSVNYLYYNLILDPGSVKFRPSDTITRIAWGFWIANAVEYKTNKLMFIEKQIERYPSILDRVLNVGYVDIVDGLDMDIYNSLKAAFLLNAKGVNFYLEENKSQLAELNFKEQLSETWLIFNRYNGELTSGSSIEVQIDYGDRTNVVISFIYPEYYRNNRKETVREVSNIISKIKDKDTDEKVRFVVNYIINNTRYPEKLTEASRYAHGALFDKEAVCTGYSDLFSIFMTELNIPNTRVWGYYGDTLHTWNAVYINNERLFVDTTLSTPDNPLILVDTLENHTWDENILKLIF